MRVLLSRLELPAAQRMHAQILYAQMPHAQMTYAQMPHA